MNQSAIAAIAAIMIIFGMARSSSGVAATPAHNYPTETRAEFVFACMSSNEMNPDFLKKCSCAIDVIASRLSFEDYQKAETIIRLQLGNSPREEAYKSVGIAKSPLEKLFRAQAASEIECF